jgi:hypothetical protein
MTESSRAIRNSRAIRSSVTLSRTNGRYAAPTTMKSKTFHPLRKKSRGRRPYASTRIVTSTVNTPRNTPFSVWSSPPISSSSDS